jgi:hypothetical protein
MNTNELIDSLAKDLQPAAPLWRPGTRAVTWSLGALLYVGILVVAMSLADRSAGGGWLVWLPQMAAIVTAILASVAAFASVVPGLPQRSRAWAAVAGVAWLGMVLAASPGEVDWADVPGANHEWACVGVIVVGGAPLMWALTLMLRRGAPLSPAVTGALAALAVGALANIGACLSLPHANGAITFAWHGGVVLALVLMAAAGGHLVFKWRARPSSVR